MVELHGQSSFNVRHVAAAITHLAQMKSASVDQPPISRDDMTLYQALLSEILDLTNVFLISCGARQLANIIWAIAHLADDESLYSGSQSSRSLIVELHSTSAKIIPLLLPLLKHCEPQHFSTIAWASAKLGLEPDDEWMDAFLVHSEKCIHDFLPQREFTYFLSPIDNK